MENNKDNENKFIIFKMIIELIVLAILTYYVFLLI